MYTSNIKDFDSVIQKAVKEIERKYNCWIFLLTDNSYWYMSIFYIAGHGEKDIKICPVNANKYTMATAIRNYFRGGR